MEEEKEYRLPAKVLTNRDPVILNRLSIREFFQWVFFFALIYLSFNALPLDFTIRLVLAATITMFGGLFIHSPINGLAGIEWIYVYSRFLLEKKHHKTSAPVTLNLGQRPRFNVSISLSSSYLPQRNGENDTQDQTQKVGDSTISSTADNNGKDSNSARSEKEPR